MTRSRIDLDGLWVFTHRVDRHSEPSAPRDIPVPGPWQAFCPDLRMKVGLGHYERAIEIPDDWIGGEEIYLHFGAVFHHATVWVNGERVGAHEGGFLNFSFCVTPQLRAGTNRIAVLAETPTDDALLYPEAPFGEIPFGKQSWYGPLSGIWQSVFLERRPADHVERIHVRRADLDGSLTADVQMRAPLRRSAVLATDLLDPEGRVLVRAEAVLPAEATEAAVALVVPEVRPWSLDHPWLYRIRCLLLQDGAAADTHEESFGFRRFEARDGAFFLNGERLILRAALDQDYYPDTICTPPSEAFIEDQFLKAKALGLNALRLHIKVPDPRYVDVADRLGLLIWTELPNGGVSTERSRRRKERLLKGIVDRHGNHPSIVIWTIINENWGVDLVHDADHRAWLKRVYRWLKSYDPGRLVVDNSPLAPSFHIETDIADYHFYAAIPDHRSAWDDFVERLAHGTAWLFSPEGDAVVTGTEPRLCSEFGNWGLPHPDRLADAEGREPWWFETGHDWGEGVMYPHGIQQRFEDWSLDRVFGSLDGFVAAAQWQQFRALKYQIEAMRRQPVLAGYVITELTDVHWESNGLLDMRRNPRAFHDRFRTINADTVLVPKQERFAFWDDETIAFDLAVAHAGPGTIEGATLMVDGAPDSTVILPPLSPGAVVELGRLVLPPGKVRGQGGRRSETCMRLTGPTGTVLATNTVDHVVHPRGSVIDRPSIGVWSADPDLRAHLRRLGYRACFAADDADLTIATAPHAALAAQVRGGGRLLLLPAAACALQPFFPHWQNVEVKERAGTLWQGDWASSFAWLRRTGPFATLPGEPLLDASFDRVLPDRIVTGCNLLDFQARVHAGMVVGWVHRPAALVVERAYGRGRLVVSTFRLFRDPPGADPTAATLTDALIALATLPSGAG